MLKSPAHAEEFLLDTHIWLWLITGDERIKRSRMNSKIEEAARHARARVSLISVWEVDMLSAKGRITLDRAVRDWVRDALVPSNLILTPMTEEIVLASSELPPDFPNDPMDKILISTAKNRGATLITCDQKILTAAKHHSIFKAQTL